MWGRGSAHWSRTIKSILKLFWLYFSLFGDNFTWTKLNASHFFLNFLDKPKNNISLTWLQTYFSCYVILQDAIFLIFDGLFIGRGAWQWQWQYCVTCLLKKCEDSVGQSYLKFIYSDLSYLVTVKSTVEISQNFVAFSEYIYELYKF